MWSNDKKQSKNYGWPVTSCKRKLVSTETLKINQWQFSQVECWNKSKKNKKQTNCFYKEKCVNIKWGAMKPLKSIG